MGVPAPDRIWSSDDYARASRVLTDLATTSPTELPRDGSPQSGAVFARMVAKENLEPLRAPGLTPQQSLVLFGSLLQGARGLLLIYFQANKEGVFDKEIAELSGLILHCSVLGQEKVRAFETELNKGGGPNEQQRRGLAQIRSGNTTIVQGAVVMLGEKHLYRVEARQQLTAHMKETLPHLWPDLSALVRKDFLNQLRKQASSETHEGLRKALNELIESLPA
jgi:hypothetical protein